MIYPIIFDVLRSFNNNELVEIGLWSVVILALGFGLVGFFIPQFQIHNLIIACKQKALEKSETVLQSFLKNLSSEECNDKETAEVIQLKIDVYYVYFHKRIINVREWPFDATVFFQLGSSLIVPILVTGIEIYSK
jgi:hypothetical protein